MRLDDEITAWYRKGRAAYLAGDQSSADYWHRAIRREHGCELYPAVELPERLLMVHPIGTVLGRATYGDHLVCYNCVNVGSDLDGNRPTIGNGVVLFSGAKVLGNVTIGSNVFVTANAVISGTTKNPVTIPDNCVVFTDWRQDYPGNMYSSRHIVYSSRHIGPEFKPTRRSVIDHFFKGAEK